MIRSEYILLKSKDDFSFEHYPTSPMCKMTGFTGTAGEAVQDVTGHTVLFVDPRYHVQAKNQITGRNVALIKMAAQGNFVDYLKKFLPKYSTLYVPQKSTNYAFCQRLIEKLDTIKIITYQTADDNTPITNPEEPVFSVPMEIAGEDIIDKIKRLDLNNYFITNLDEIAYLLNLRAFKTQNSANFRAKLFIHNEEDIKLFCDYRLPDLPFAVKVAPLREYENFIKRLNTLVTVDVNDVSLYDYNLIRKPNPIKKSAAGLLASVKNQNEIIHYKDCFKRLDSALYEFRNQIEEGLSEFELKEILERAMINHGAKCTSFKTILAIGENSSIIHYTGASKERILKSGEIILVDCGAYYEGGYATDITRVFKCKGETDPAIQDIYTAVLRAQLNAYYSKIMIGDELHNLAAGILKKYEVAGFYFPHGLGHGIGIPVHQAPPTLSPRIKIKLKDGFIFSIEPGLYKPGAFGVRLENAVCVQNGEKVTLSHFPYEEGLINYNLLADRELAWLKEWNDRAKEMQ